MIVLLLFLATTAATAGETKLSLVNDRLEFSVDFSLAGGRCVLRDRRTGESYEAPDFGVICVWDYTEDRVRTVLMSPEAATSRCGVTVKRRGPTEATVRVDTGRGSPGAMGQLSFGVAFDIELKLTGNTLEYAIPIASLREEQPPAGIPQRWRLMSVELLPHLGATPAGAPGYLVIPSWSGAVYYFDRRHPRANRGFDGPGFADPGSEAGLRVRWGYRPDAPAEYGSMVYGVQAAWEDQLQQPVYGTVRARGGLMGVLLSGEYDMELRARRHQGPRRTASVNPVFHYRRFWHSKLDRVDRRVRLIALDRAQASYAGIGRLFREYLVRERGIETLRQRAAANEAVAYFMDSAYVRIMMGMKEAAIDGSGPMRSYQSWDQVAAAIPLFRAAGFEKISFIFVGANYQGHDGAHPTVFPLEKAHGGEKAFRRMLKQLTAAGYRAAFHLNYKDCYRCSPDWDPKFVQINEYGELRFHGAWIGGYSYQGIPQEMLERFGRRDLPRLKALGLRGLHYWDACLSVMEETFPPNRVITRREYGEGAMAYFRYAAELFGAVSCETSIAPLLGLVTHVGNTHMPHGGMPGEYKGNGFSQAALIDHWVPLQHIIYHGLAAYGGGPEVAGRAGGSFWKAPEAETIAELWKRWQESRTWGGALDYEFIESHEAVADGVFRTTLSDGARIWVNRTDQTWQEAGMAVAPKGYTVRGADR
jgi:hypothetical protein